MRLLLALLLSLALAAGTVRADGLEFVRIWPGWRDGESFSRISEYFTGKENTSGQEVVRTHAGDRAGFYFLVRVKNSGPAESGVKAVLSLIRPDSPLTRTYDFAVTLPPGETVFNLGLTGSDWPDRKSHPVAWKLELFSSSGQSLGARQSFMWAQSVP